MHRPVGALRAEVLTGHRGARRHQPDGRPRDEREQLRVADRVRGLRLGALPERADEAQQQEPRDVHGDPLNPGGQAKAEQRPNDSPVGSPVHPAVPPHREAPRQEEVAGDATYGETRHRRAHGRARGPEARRGSDAGDEHDVARDVEDGEQHAEA